MQSRSIYILVYVKENEMKDFPVITPLLNNSDHLTTRFLENLANISININSKVKLQKKTEEVVAPVQTNNKHIATNTNNPAPVLKQPKHKKQQKGSRNHSSETAN